MLKNIIALSILCEATSGAMAATADEVMTRHVETLKAFDLDGLMADYADDAVAVYPKGIYVGKAEIRRMMEGFAAGKEALSKMDVTIEPLGQGAYSERFVINPGTPKQVTGVDVMVIREGKIVFQAAQPRIPVAAPKQ